MLKDFSPRDNVFIFCVVFEDQKRSRFFNSRYIEANSIKFGLEELNKEFDNFYDEIITQDVDFYKSNFINLACQ